MIARLPEIAAARLRCRLSRADPPDRPGQPQGPRQQYAWPRRAIRAAPMRSAPRRAGTRRSIPNSARSRISAVSSPPPPGSGWRWRSISRSSAPPTIRGCASTRAGSTTARRLDQIRREPAEEIRGHRQRRFLQPGPRGVVDRAARHRAVLGRPGGAHLPGRQPAHQAGAVLGMDDPRGEGALPRRGVPVGGVHPAEDDAAAGQGRVHPVLHLLHLAQHQGRIDRVPDRADAGPGQGILPAELLRQHARHPAGVFAGGRPPGLPHPAGAGRHLVAGLRHLQRLRIVRERRRSPAARNTSTPRNTSTRCGTGTGPATSSATSRC